ncbi:MAG: sulfide:quinone oxidoreductase [Actinomycetota bacterium]|jgi:sulfide:quinone oxidoreductase|nr:sulfide:quinone oxidoreductase [Actinomycetota bacterium]
MSKKVVVLGAGFGGLELSTMLSEELGDEVAVTVIDRNDGFSFGYSKLDLMFRGTSLDSVTLPYREVAKPGVRLLKEEITAIDARNRSVTTDAGTHEADFLVIALGADYDLAATPGLAEHGNEFYSFKGAERAAGPIADFDSGNAVIGVCGAPFKCPPAPSECALMLSDQLSRRGVRDQCEITFVLPLPSPVPPSPETSTALISEFEARGIRFMSGRRPVKLDAGEVTLDDGSTLPFDLFLGVPKHQAPQVVIESGITEDGYVTVDSATLKTKYEGVYAVGDVATAGVPKAGVFAEGAARVVARELIAELRGGGDAEPFDGRGSCYIEFGEDQIARVDIDFLSGPEKSGVFNAPSLELRDEKDEFGSSRKARWFGL